MLFQEDEEHREDQAEEGGEVVPLEGLALEEEVDDDREDGQGDGFLDDLQLHEVEGTAVAGEADAVGRDGEAVFEEGDAPGEQDDQDQRPAGRDFHLLEFEVAVPRECHEDIRADQHQDSPNSLLHNACFQKKRAKIQPFPELLAVFRFLLTFNELPK